MSYSTVVELYPGEKIICGEELRNGHGTGPCIWRILCEAWFQTAGSYMFDGTMDKLWPKYKDLSIPRHQRAVLMMTYDMAYVEKKDYAQAAKDIRQFFEDFSYPNEYVNHWPRIAEIYESDPDCPAIGLHQTSVTENPFEGEWNEDIEDYDPIDWEQCYSIYAELDAVEADQTEA